MKDSCRNPWCEKAGKLPLGNPEVRPVPRFTPWVIMMGNFAELISGLTSDILNPSSLASHKHHPPPFTPIVLLPIPFPGSSIAFWCPKMS